MTWIGDAEKIEDDEDAKERYYSYFPQSRAYHNTHHFDFYRIKLVRARYIGGFGKIFWVKNDLLTKENPFFGEVERSMVTHMNEDHKAAMVKYCQRANVSLDADVEPLMAGIDAEGMHLLIEDKIIRIPFSEAVNEPAEVRKQLVAMAA